MMSKLADAQTSLHDKLAKQALRPAEMVEGVQEIFFTCQYQYAAQRQIDVNMDEIDRLSRTMVENAFREIGIMPQNASPVIVRYVAQLLSERFGFAQDKELLAFQQRLLHQLLRKPIQYIVHYSSV